MSTLRRWQGRNGAQVMLLSSLRSEVCLQHYTDAVAARKPRRWRPAPSSPGRWKVGPFCNGAAAADGLWRKVSLAGSVRDAGDGLTPGAPLPAAQFLLQLICNCNNHIRSAPFVTALRHVSSGG